MKTERGGDMKAAIKNDRRVPLTGEFGLTFLDVNQNPYEYRIQIKEVIGRGASCLCYAVTVDCGGGDVRRMVMKQFYPDPMTYEVEIEPRGAQLIIYGFEQRKDLQDAALRFESSYTLQRELANREELAHTVVKPYLKSFSQEGRFILYDEDYGNTLEKCRLTDAREILETIRAIARGLARLHRNKILHMDLKPGNILRTQDRQIRFFDFDASIRMDALEEIHTIYGDGEQEALLAPELRMAWDFEQDKQVYLKPRVDVYAVGAMLFSYFMGRYPTAKECEEAVYAEALRELCEDTAKYRGVFTESEREQLVRIIQRSISSSIKKRYESCDALAADLDILLEAMKTTANSAAAKDERVNYRLLAAYVLADHPLCPYRIPISESYEKTGGVRKKAPVCPRGQEGLSWSIDVVLSGNSKIREELLRHVFACAQMYRTTLRLHLIEPEASAYLQVLALSWPELFRMSRVFLNERPYRQEEFDAEGITEPLAELSFYDGDLNEETFERYVKLWENRATYYLLADRDCGKNYRTALYIAKYGLVLPGQRIFVGYAEERGDGYGMRRIAARRDQVDTAPFGCNAAYSVSEKQFQRGIGRQAFAVHTWYIRERQERMSRQEIWKSFSAEHYNIRSSIRSALSIPYKCISVGIRPDAAGFYDCVLLNTPQAIRNRGRLIRLEQRSWLAFMVTEGYRRPTRQELEAYAYSGQNDQRDRKRKLHPLMCDCSEQGILLDGLTRKEWTEERDLSENEIVQRFDPLDRISLLLHRLCVRRMAEGSRDPRIEAALYRDYKTSVLSVLLAVPWLMSCDRVRKIYKPFSETLWQNAMSAMLLEPEELVLLADRIDAKASAKLHDFLAHRGLRTKVSVRRPEHVRAGGRGKKSMLDLTGADQGMLLRTSRNQSLMELPSFVYEGGRLCVVSGKAETEKLLHYDGRKTLSVEEALLLGEERTDFFREEKNGGSPCARLRKGMEDGGLCVKRMEGKAERSFCAYLPEGLGSPEERDVLFSLLEQNEQSNRFTAVWKEQTRHSFETDCVPGRALADTGLEALLSDLQACGAVEAYEAPGAEEEAPVRVWTGLQDLEDVFAVLIDRMQREPYRHFYVLEQIQETEGTKMVVIVDETLYVKSSAEKKTDCDKDAVQQCRILKQELEALEKIGLIQKLPSCPDFAAEADGVCEVKFRFAGRAARKILRSERHLLRAYVYGQLERKGEMDDLAFSEGWADLIGTKHLKTYFFVCCHKWPNEQEQLQLLSHAGRAGADGRTVLVCFGDRTAQGTHTEDGWITYQELFAHHASASDSSSGYEKERALQNVSAGRSILQQFRSDGGLDGCAE